MVQAGTIDSVSLDIEIDLASFKTRLAKAKRQSETTANAMAQAIGRIGQSFGPVHKEIAKTTTSLGQGLKPIRKDLSLVERGFTTLGTAIKKNVVGLIADIAVDSLVEGFEAVVSSTAALGNQASAIGLSVEALQEWRFAAQQSGVEAQAFEAGAQHLTQSLGLFAQDGGGPAAKAFKQLGIDARDATGNIRPTGDVLDEIVRKMGGVRSQAERAALASQLFGNDAGPKLAVLLRQGEEAIRKLRDEARESGAILDEALVRKAQEIQLEWEKLVTIIGTKIKSAILGTIVAIESAFDSTIVGPLDFGKALEKNREQAEALRQKLVELAETPPSQISGRGRFAPGARPGAGTQRALDALLARDPDVHLERIRKRLAEINAELAKAPRTQSVAGRGRTGNPLIGQLEAERSKLEAQREAIKRQEELSKPPPVTGSGRATETDNIRKVIEALEFERAQLDRNTTQQQIYNALRRAGIDIGDAVVTNTGEIVGVVSEEAAAIAESVVAIERSSEARVELADAIEEEIKLNEMAQDVINSTKTNQELLTEEKERLVALLPKLIELLGTQEEAWKVLNKAMENAELQYREVDEEAEELARIGFNALDDALHALTDGLRGNIKGWKAWGAAVLDILGDALLAWIRFQDAQSRQAGGGGEFDFLGSLFSFFGSVAGSAAGGGSSSSLITGDGVGNPNFLPPNFAHGGSFKVGGAGGIDSQLVQFRATPGELVDVRTPGSTRSGEGNSFTVNFNGPTDKDSVGLALPQLRRELGQMVRLAGAGDL